MSFDAIPGLTRGAALSASGHFSDMATWLLDVCLLGQSGHRIDARQRPSSALLGILQELRDKGVDLFLHQQGLDTSTTAGKAMFQMLGVFAEFERGIIRERVNAGLARARANGTKLGRRRVDPAVEAKILELKPAATASSRSAGNLASAPVWCSAFSSKSGCHLNATKWMSPAAHFCRLVA